MEKYQIMLAKLGNSDILNRKSLAGYIFEPKFDGTRVLIYKEGNDIELINRRGKDITFKYPELLEIPRNINCETCVLDAELVVLNKKGKPDYNLLQQREQLDNKMGIESRSRTIPSILFVFDVLEKNNKQLINKPLGDRKRILREMIKNSPFISLAPYTTKGREFWKQVQEQEIEGMIAKELGSRYEQDKRSWSWLKIKSIDTLDTIIVGFTKGKDEREKYFDSLVLAVHVPDKGELVFIGKVETGFNRSLLKRLTKRIKKLTIEKSELNEEEQSKIQSKIKEKVIWTKPELIAEIKYQELTKDKLIEEASFMRLRFDKNLKDCLFLS